MTALRLKHYMPRGLYGRAALILVLPVVLLQLVVSVIFIQRHFEDVTTQMTHTVIRELQLIIGQASAADSSAMALVRMGPTAEVLDFDLRFVGPDEIPATDSRYWYDFSGIVMRNTVREALPQAGPPFPRWNCTRGTSATRQVGGSMEHGGEWGTPLSATG